MRIATRLTAHYRKKDQLALVSTFIVRICLSFPGVIASWFFLQNARRATGCRFSFRRKEKNSPCRMWSVYRCWSLLLYSLWFFKVGLLVTYFCRSHSLVLLGCTIVECFHRISCFLNHWYWASTVDLIHWQITEIYNWCQTEILAWKLLLWTISMRGATIELNCHVGGGFYVEIAPILPGR